MTNNNANDKSLSIPGAGVNLALAIPPAIFRALATKIIRFFNSYFQNMLKVVLNLNTDSKNFPHEVNKSKKMAKINDKQLILVVRACRTTFQQTNRRRTQGPS